MNIHYFEIEYSFFWFLFELNLNKLKNLKIYLNWIEYPWIFNSFELFKFSPIWVRALVVSEKKCEIEKIYKSGFGRYNTDLWWK